MTDIEIGPRGSLFVVSLDQGTVYEIRRARGRDDDEDEEDEEEDDDRGDRSGSNSGRR